MCVGLPLFIFWLIKAKFPMVLLVCTYYAVTALLHVYTSHLYPHTCPIVHASSTSSHSRITLCSPSSPPPPHALTLQEEIASTADDVYMVMQILAKLTELCSNLMALEALRCKLATLRCDFFSYLSTLLGAPITLW